MTDTRRDQLRDWANAELGKLLPGIRTPLELEIVSGDASFRRYFRARAEHDGLSAQSFIAVDAPPDNEDSRRFVSICKLFGDAGVITPRVFAAEYELGFMLLDDFGDTIYLDELLSAQQQGRMDEVDRLYGHAIDALLSLQANVNKDRLNPYDRNELHREMALFEEWFCVKFLGLRLDDESRELIAETLRYLEDQAIAQPVVAVHRDYHSRNLMILDSQKFGADCGPGIIDFQDAVSGAYTYDLVSLLRDCYVRWSPEQVDNWALTYLQRAIEMGIIEPIESQQFLQHFDLMGLQRNLKVMGIFARLGIRDNKPRYLADIPLVIHYFLEVSQRYGPLTPFVDWFKQAVLPLAKTKLKLDY
ncbi:MAG: phosphotransferase [Gammaproteobacteria bacterium]|nr:phosphotransferase [Gammaproteobacteria bacterium]MDP6731832.1 phosphotransferase [Gammaproteobacteria bacterium]